jgi:hypothetical protein
VESPLQKREVFRSGKIATEMNEGIQTRVFGPKAAAGEAAGAGFVLPKETARQLIELFTNSLAQRQHGPVQMLVEAPDMPTCVVNVSRFYGQAAVAHVLRAPPTGDVPALAGVYVLLPGVDTDADEAAIASVESSRDKAGAALPLPPDVFATLRAEARPLFAMIFFTEETLTDVSLRMLGVCLAEAFFTSVRRAGKQEAPGTRMPGA